MTDQPQNPKPRKVQKKVNSYFLKNDVVMGDIPSSVVEEPSCSVRVESHEIDVNHIERDPGKRPAISSYPINERDEVRRKYILYGPYQPKLEEYPTHLCGDQDRRFNGMWFEKYHWLEYSDENDKAFCFPCFLFDSDPSRHSLFTSYGFDNWRRIGGVQCCFKKHVGKTGSPHHKSMQDMLGLKHVCRHIDKVMNPQPPELIQQNRLRLKATIEAVRLLAKQALAFRGDDESAESSNRGNVVEVVDSYGRMNEEVAKVTLENAPRNATYTSPKIQKEILSILANRVRRKIREEVGEAKFCLLVDEALDESKKEQMAIILRFVDSHGFVRERFFHVVSVSDTCAATLKSKIDNVLTEYNLQVENLRGQGYDGASNMRGEWNGLQALFLQKCPYAYYVHCFAHRLQLALNAAAKDVGVVYLFFQMLTSIINVVDSSAKRVSELKSIQEVEVVEQIAAGELETGKGANQTCNLQRAGATRWSSRYYSIKNLMKLYNSTSSVLKNMIDNGLNGKIRGEALGASKALRSFDFVFCLLLLDKTMGITNALCKSLQEQSQEIINAMNLVSSTKGRLQKLRENGWVDFFASVVSFCDAHTIDAPDFSARHMEGTGRLSQQQNCITIEHYYRVEIFNAVIDFQLMELNSRFNEQTRELLILSSALDPRFDFQSFDIDKICCLAEKFYPHDVPDLNDLRDQLEHFEYQFSELSEFQDLCTLSELCQEFVNTRTPFLLIERLVRLVMTLPVSTATTERAFSAMKLIKNRLRSKMSDDFLADLMTVHIEREIVDTIDSNSVIDEFYASGNRRAQLK
ncbi:hypothetical protein ABKV19_003607 [Rosa sericea]